MVTYTIIINEAPYGMERAYTGLRFARTCVFECHKVNLFLIENGVYLAKKGQKPSSNQPNLGEFLEDLIKDGAEVKVCVACIQARGLAESDLIAGVKIAALNELVEWTTNSDKIVVF
jgi:tRNA 2-thiouridine synthesizing protein D